MLTRDNLQLAPTLRQTLERGTIFFAPAICADRRHFEIYYLAPWPSLVQLDRSTRNSLSRLSGLYENKRCHLLEASGIVLVLGRLKLRGSARGLRHSIDLRALSQWRCKQNTCTPVKLFCVVCYRTHPDIFCTSFKLCFVRRRRRREHGGQVNRFRERERTQQVARLRTLAANAHNTEPEQSAQRSIAAIRSEEEFRNWSHSFL